MDRSDEFRSFFLTKRCSSQESISPSIPLSQKMKDPVHRSSVAVSNVAMDALHSSKMLVEDVLLQMLECGQETSMERDLLLSDTELVASLASVNQFEGTLHALVRSRGGVQDDSLLHHIEVATILQIRLGLRRIHIAVCREELEHQKSFARRVLHGFLAPEEGSLGKKISSSDDSSMMPSSSSLKLAPQRLVLAAADSVANSVLRIAKKKGIVEPQVVPAVRHVFTAAEELRFIEEHAALVEHEKQSHSSSARQVEKSVSELAQLTSLLNEKLVLQEEHMSIVQKNTDDAAHHLQKTAQELKKPQSRWLNPTRTLIVVLWVSTGVVVVANWMVR